jgi:hypothetical protein
MHLHVVVTVAALLSASFNAHADMVTASAVPTFTILPSADTLSFSAITRNVSVPGSFTQPGVFIGGDSGSLVQTVPFTFSDTVTVDGVTRVLNFTGTDNVSSTLNFLNINRVGPVTFNSVTVTFGPVTASTTVIGQAVPLNLNGALVSTLEPSSVVLVGGSLLFIGFLMNSMTRTRNSAP